MTGQERDYDEVLSRVLHSTTDHIEPVGDGLTKIQARLAEPWLKRQWWLLRSEFTAIGWVLAVRCQSWFNQMRSGSAAGTDTDAATGKASAGVAGHGGRLRSLPVLGGIAARAEAKRPRHASSSIRNSVGPAMAWLRPALAVAGAVVLVVAGVFAAGQIRATIGFENANNSNTSNSNNGSGPGRTNGSGSPAGSNGQSATQGSTTPTKTGSTPNSKMSPSPTSVSPSPGSASVTPSPPPTSPPPTSPPPTSPPPTSPPPSSPPPSSPPPSSPPPTAASTTGGVSSDGPTASGPVAG